MAYSGQTTPLNTTAFVETASAEVTPQIQLEFTLGIDPNLTDLYTTNEGLACLLFWKGRLTMIMSGFLY